MPRRSVGWRVALLGSSAVCCALSVAGGLGSQLVHPRPGFWSGAGVVVSVVLAVVDVAIAAALLRRYGGL